MDMPEDASRDEWYAEIYDEISSEAIVEFSYERLRSYYIKNPSLATNVVSLYKEALGLVDSSPTAALLLFTTVIEAGLKITLLKPVIYGLVHNESVADLISDLVVKNNGIDRFKTILSRIMDEYGEIDVDTYAVEGHKKTIWEEITVIQKTRNDVAHKAVRATPEIVTLARDVASAILVNFLQDVLLYLGLQLKENGEICT